MCKHTSFLTAALVAASFCFTPQSAHADSGCFVHVVRPGETLASIAERFYGDTKYEKVLVAANGLSVTGASATVVGMPLFVPYSFYYTAEQGDTWSRLAERFLGDSKRARALISSNDTGSDKQPEEGSQVLIPYLVRHVADQRDDLNKVAMRFYGSKKAIGDLRRFNRLSRNRLGRGQIVLVPLPELTLSKQGKKYIRAQNGSIVTATDIKSLQEQIIREIPRLKELVRKGAYVSGLALGHELLGSHALASSQRLAVYKELATVYVAMNRNNHAVEFFQKALRIRPDLEIDTARTSPKVLAALSKARKSTKK